MLDTDKEPDWEAELDTFQELVVTVVGDTDMEAEVLELREVERV